MCKKYKQRGELKPWKECNFEDWHYYYVWISCFDGNPPFKAVVYTGASSSAYRTIFAVSEVKEVNGKMRFEIINKIGDGGY